jgi:hypothetical protein
MSVNKGEWKMKKILSLGAVIALGAAAPVSATILTFDVAGGVSNFKPLVQTYGDNVVASPDGNGHSYAFGSEGATPNVTIQYGTPGEAPALWTTGYGDLTNIYFNDADGDTTFTTTFTADAGFLVDLYSFELASFLSAGQTIMGLTVTDLDTMNVLYSQGSTALPGSGQGHLDIDFGSPLSANRLALVIDLTGLGGVSDDIGMDNIRFGQRLETVGAVPEPASWAMMIAGFGLTGGAMRRRPRARLRFS